MNKEEAYKFAMDWLKENEDIDWDDLPDVNSMWDYLHDDMDEQEVIEAACEAYQERLSEDFGDMLDLMED